jgi:chorismate mutase
MRAMPAKIFERVRGRRAGASSGGDAPAQDATNVLPPWAVDAPSADERIVDLERRRDQLAARVAELQWDLGGLVYEMAVRDRIAVDVLVQRAAALQEADAELGEVERILHTEQTGTAGACMSCGAPHSSGAVFCWQCGQPLLAQVPSDAIGAA